jgi:DNA-binding MarR family transcriptional regulator
MLTVNDRVDLLQDACHRARPDLNWDHLSITLRIAAVSRHISQLNELTFSDFGLNSAGFDVLATLHAEGAPYQLSPTALYRRLWMSSAGITSRLDRLEQAGYLARSHDSADRRAITVTLKKPGLSLVDKAVPELLARQTWILSALGDKRAGRLSRLLNPILTKLEEADRGAIDGQGIMQAGGPRAFVLIEDQWRRDRPELDRTLVGLTGRITLIARGLRRDAERTVGACGISAANFEVISALRHAASERELSPTELSRWLTITSAGMTGRLDQAEKAGLVARSFHPTDRRGIVIRLTPRGSELIDASIGPYNARRAQLLEPLTNETKNELTRLLRRSLASLEEPARPGDSAD